MHSRRSILGRLAAVMASTPVAVATLSAAPVQAQPPLVGPITPDQYIATMHSMGWSVFAGCWIREGVEVHAGVIEHIDDWYAWNRSEEDQSLNVKLRKAIEDSGIDFYDRVSDRLYELRLREQVGPKKRKVVPS
ncbi:MAG: hypothetical protein H0V72_09450 [Bradyrhizobium sp.]|nr:hypothetical protein [Bradyrhizobium sp.]